MPPVSGYLRYLSGWIGVVALMAFGNTISCFVSHGFLADKLYTEASGQVNGLMARLFGIWTLLASALRLYCALHIRNIQLYNLTFVSFILAFGHFVTEVFIYKTAALTVGIAAPLIVSGISICGMLIGYSCLYDDEFEPLNQYKASSDCPDQHKILHHRLVKSPGKKL